MSLRWTAYVTLKPARGELENAGGRFPYKSGLVSKKVATKLLYVKIFNSKVVRQLLAYLTVHKMVGGGCRFLHEIMGQIDQPLEKRRLQIDIRL